MIREYTQGEKHDEELFGLVGALALSIKVHEELGASVSSQDGDVWFVYSGTGGETTGFAQMRMAKNGTVHVRYVYSENAGVRASLVSAAVAKAKKLSAEKIYTNDRKAAMEWSKAEFKKQPTNRKGEFVRWEREL